MVIGTDADLRCWVEQFRDLKPLTPYMPCSFGLLPHPRSEPRAQLNDPLRVTVTVRWLPLVTAAYGTWVARPARTTTFARGGDGSRPNRWGRPVLTRHCFVGKPSKTARQPGVTSSL
jgi:hypothetical protein